MKIGEEYKHSGKNGVATIVDVVKAGGQRKNNGTAVIYIYESVKLKMGKHNFLRTHARIE